MRKSVLFFAWLGLAVAAPPALAQTGGNETATSGDAAAPPGGAPAGSSTEASSTAGSAPAAGGASPTVIHVHTSRHDDDERPQQSPLDPHELSGESYHHVGVFARGIFAPQFIQNLFVAGGTNALNAGVGVFYNHRRDGLNIIAEVWWAGFYATGPFRGLNETDFETEWVESELSVVFGSLALMWSIPLASWLAIEVGVGIGFGGVFGGLYRTEAYPDGSGWTACAGEGNPNPQYCDPSVRSGGEGSYQRIENSPEPYNFSGGVPPLWFWVDLPRLAVRIKPLRQLQIRVEGGYAAYAFYAGGSVAFGF